MDKHRSSLSLNPEGLTIISGGQTGVDRAALDAALALGIPVGGWCPRGRRAEDGHIPPEYPLTETRSWKYLVRTERNVQDSDGTLIITLGEVSGGTRLTLKFARQHNRPVRVVRLLADGEDSESRLFPDQTDVRTVVEWIAEHKISVLNVAGPRGSSDDRIHPLAEDFCRQVFEATLKLMPCG